ncbi:MAG: hypothetical protein JSR46_02300, partial [Verrucomicrobia bacterium]|nr:hypothetical protein [Verrucomicrobiota bacterium]
YGNSNKKESYRAEITDFDDTIDMSKEEQPSWLSPSYATTAYTAPEVDITTHKKISETEAMARDMYAIGCICNIILELHQPTVAQNENEPAYRLYELISYKMIFAETIDLCIAEKMRLHSLTYREELEFMAYNLLHPNPEKRWTCEQFKWYITDLQRRINMK